MGWEMGWMAIHTDRPMGWDGKGLGDESMGWDEIG